MDSKAFANPSKAHFSNPAEWLRSYPVFCAGILAGLTLCSTRSSAPAAAKDVNEAPTLVLQGMRLHRAGNLAEAEAKWRQALEADPDNPLARDYLRSMGRSVTNAISHWLDGISRKLPVPEASIRSPDRFELPPDTPRMKFFRIEPQALMGGMSDALAQVGGSSQGSNSARTLEAMVRAHFRAGDFPLKLQAIDYEERGRLLSIAGPTEALRRVEETFRTMEALPTPRVRVEVNILELTEATAQRLNLLGGLGVWSRSSEPDRAASVAPGSAAATYSGRLEGPQFRLMLRTLKEEPGVIVTYLPRMLTPSGSQAQAKLVRVRPLATGPALASAGDSILGSGKEGKPAQQPVTEPFELGVMTDVVPLVDGEGEFERGIQLTAIATLKEFFGYDSGKPGEGKPVPGAKGLEAPTAPVNGTPLFRLQQVIASTRLKNDETLFLYEGAVTMARWQAGAAMEMANWVEQTPGASRKMLLVFVTPSLRGPDGEPELLP